MNSDSIAKRIRDHLNNGEKTTEEVEEHYEEVSTKEVVTKGRVTVIAKKGVSKTGDTISIDGVVYLIDKVSEKKGRNRIELVRFDE